MKNSKISLVLMELIGVIFFFSLTAAVCLQVFVKAHVIGENTTNLNNAVLYAENTGELFYEYKEDFMNHIDLITDNVADNLSVELIPSSDDDFLYLTYNCYVKGKTDPIYTIDFKQHIKEVAGNEQ